jgi:AcrR family transcriptional regulator
MTPVNTRSSSAEPQSSRPQAHGDQPSPPQSRPEYPRPESRRPPSARQDELLDRAYHYALEHGLADLSLRPLAAAIGTSPRVLLFLFGSKDGLVRALLARARADELGFLAGERAADQDGLAAVVAATWRWLAAEPVRPLLTLWTEAYGRSLVEPDGPWSGFASQSVDDWLTVLASAQPADHAGEPEPTAERTLALAVLRGCLLDLLATGDTDRVSAAVASYLRLTTDSKHGR